MELNSFAHWCDTSLKFVRMSADAVTAKDDDDNVDNGNPDDLRQLGNRQFAQKNYDVAAAFYTQAIELLEKEYRESYLESGLECNNDQETPPPRPTALLLNLCNRSACYFQMEMYKEAKADAGVAWNFLPQLSNIKAAYRLAKTMIALEEYDEGKELILRVFQVLEEVDQEEKGKRQRQKQEKESSPPEKPEDSIKTHYRAFEELLKTLENKQKNHGKEPPKVSIRDFTLDEELGFGNFSEIYRVTHKKTGKEFALKRINKKKIADLGCVLEISVEE